MTLVSPAAQKPPIRVIPTKTSAVTSIPDCRVNTPGSSARRMAPPATYWREVITIWITSWPITPSTRAVVL